MIIEIRYTTKIVNVLICKHKNIKGYSFINLDKQTISPCIFNTIDEAIKDFTKREDFISYKIMEEYTIGNKS